MLERIREDIVSDTITTDTDVVEAVEFLGGNPGLYRYKRDKNGLFCHLCSDNDSEGDTEMRRNAIRISPIMVACVDCQSVLTGCSDNFWAREVITILDVS